MASGPSPAFPTLPPIVLYADYGQRGLRVVLGCQQSRRQGIRTDMPLAEAKGILGISRVSADSPCFLPHDPGADLAALKQLAVWCGRFSPFVGIEGDDSLLIDLTGCIHLFGGERKLCRRISNTFRAWGLSIRMAIADTVGAAWACARYGKARRELEESMTPSPPQTTCDHRASTDCGGEGRGEGRTQSRRNVGPSPQPYPPLETYDLMDPPQRGRGRMARTEVIIVPSGQQSKALRPLPILALRLSDDVVEALQELGVDRIEQFLVLPRASLPARFGSRILRQWDRAIGETEELIEPVRASEPLILSADFEHAVHTRDELLQALQRLVSQLMRQLAERQTGLQGLEIQLRLANQSTRTLSLGLLRPSPSVAHVMDLLRLQWEQLTLNAEVLGLSLHAVTIGLLEVHQTQLFEREGNFRSRRELARLIDRFRSRLGEGRVVHPRVHEDAQPELALRWESAGTNASAVSRAVVRFRPLRLYPQPRPIEVMSVVPEGPPIRFLWESRLHTVARYWGPERIETGWWREHPIRRDYYRVETQTGQRFWLFRRRTQEDWYLQGDFE